MTCVDYTCISEQDAHVHKETAVLPIVQLALKSSFSPLQRVKVWGSYILCTMDFDLQHVLLQYWC